MIVTPNQFQAYIRVIKENSVDGDDILRLLEEIVTGEWEASISFCDVESDPMDDFNYVGSKHHYWVQTNHTI